MKALVLILFVSLASPAIGQDAAHFAPPAAGENKQDAGKPYARISPEKEGAIRKLFEVAGTRAAVEKVIAGMTDNMKPMLSKMLPPGEYQNKLIPLFLEKFRSKLKTEDLLDLTASVYDKHFSKQDIEDLTAFYQTPLGKKVLSVLPQVLIESQTAGMKMGEDIGRQSMVEVLAEHPELARAMKEAGGSQN